MAAARAATLLQPPPRQPGCHPPFIGTVPAGAKPPEQVLQQPPDPGRLPSTEQLYSCGTAGLDTSPQHPFWRRARALDQGGRCQSALHLSQEKSWKILKAIDPRCIWLLSFSLPVNICQDFCLQLDPSLPAAAVAVLAGKCLQPKESKCGTKASRDKTVL